MIKIAQIDPFSCCNNKCWYCPVKYYEQPKEAMVHMPPELFEKMIKNLVEEKGNLVSDTFDFIYTAHYNEIILYQYLKEMLEILRKYKIKTMLLSNGVAFTEYRLNIIKEFKDVIAGINFNIPSFEKVSWSVETGQDEKLLEPTIENVRRVYKEFGQIVSVGMNSMNPAEAHARVSYAKTLIPDMNIYPAIGLCDRAGLLHDKQIISNRAEIDRNKEGKTKIIGCKNAQRVEEWLHVNALGQAFICCNDYFFKYTFGDFNTQTLAEIWQSEERQQTIEKAKDTLCTKCSFAIWQ